MPTYEDMESQGFTVPLKPIRPIAMTEGSQIWATTNWRTIGDCTFDLNEVSCVFMRSQAKGFDRTEGRQKRRYEIKLATRQRLVMTLDVQFTEELARAKLKAIREKLGMPTD